jgi:hypothetical protein
LPILDVGELMQIKPSFRLRPGEVPRDYKPVIRPLREAFTPLGVLASVFIALLALAVIAGLLTVLMHIIETVITIF